MGDKLKTLKDINPTGKTGCLRCENIGEACAVCYIQTLKQEAIKWAKSMRNENNEFENIERCELSHNRGTVMDADDFIKHFLNITEEDLK